MADLRIFRAIQEGRLHRLKDLVAETSPENLQKTMTERFSRVTPLLEAIRRCAMQQNSNSCDVVEFLVKHCGADVEQTGSVMFMDGDEIHDAPPLWIASAVGCLRCVRLLVEAGANVNATTSTNSTPLRAACFDGHLEIVMYLVEHGADMEIANQHGHTCLMISCYKKHLQVAAFLLDRGAQVNRQSLKGNTAMHDAAEASHMEILKLLVRNGATFLRDCYNLTPLMTAALAGNRVMVCFLRDVFQVSTEEMADALKLLGATYVDKFNDLTAAHTTWRAAMETVSRMTVENQATYRDRLLQSSKEVSAAYGEGAREIATVADLEELYCDLEKMHMQALLIRERILGISHPETFYFVRFRGADYADRRDYSRTLALWLYALERLTTTCKPFCDMTYSLYLSIFEIFNLMSKMESMGGSASSVLQTYDVFRVLRLALGELLHPQNDYLFHQKDCDNDNNNNEVDNEVDGGDDCSSSSSSKTSRTKKYCTRLTRKLPALRGRHRGGWDEGVEDNLASGEGNPRAQQQRAPLNTFNADEGGNIIDRHFLLIIQLIGLMVRLRPQMSQVEWRCFQHVIYDFVSLEPRSATSYTLLHILTFITPAVLPSPLLPIAPLGDLFEMVATVSRRLDVIDLEGNTALHLLFRQMGEQQKLLKKKEERKKSGEDKDGERENIVHHSPADPAGMLQLRRNMAEQLLARGAHIDLVNEEGCSPLDYVETTSLGNHFKVNCMSLACRAATVIVAARLPLDSLPDDARAFVQRHQPKGFSANVYEDEEEEEGAAAADDITSAAAAVNLKDGDMSF